MVATASPSKLSHRSHHTRRAVVRWVKRGLLAVAAAALVAAIVRAWLPSPIAVDVATATRRPLSVEVAEDGRTRVRERFVVSAPLSGELERVALEPGDGVDAGGAVARIRAPEPALLDERSRTEATARLSAAQAHERQAATAIGRATAARDLAVRDAERSRALAGQHAITESERERAELAERVAIDDVAAAIQARDAARAEVAAIAAQLGRASSANAVAVAVASPSSGRVLRVLRESAGPIAAGTPILEVGDPRMLDVVIDVLSSDATRIAPKMTVWIDAGSGEPCVAEVRRVEPSAFTRVSALGVEEQRVNVIASFEKPPAGLGDGFRVDARIVTWHSDAALAIPASALFRDGEAWAVYAVSAGRAVLQRVVLGHHGRVDVEILEGLHEGDRVILHPGDTVSDGAELDVR